MKAKELIKRIKAGADVYAPVSVAGGKDWQYAKLDSESLLIDLQTDEYFKDLDCESRTDHPGSPVWFGVPKD